MMGRLLTAESGRVAHFFLVAMGGRAVIWPSLWFTYGDFGPFFNQTCPETLRKGQKRGRRKGMERRLCFSLRKGEVQSAVTASKP